MSFRSETEDALRELESDLGTCFKHQGTEYPCVAGMAALSGVLEHGGLGMDQELRIHVRSSLMPGAISVKSVISYADLYYTVDSISSSPDGGFYLLDCTRHGRGA